MLTCPSCNASLPPTSRGRVPDHTAGMKTCRGSGGISLEDLKLVTAGMYTPLANLIWTAVVFGMKSAKELVKGV